LNSKEDPKLEQKEEEKPKEEAPQLSEKELQNIQRIKEENKNPYIASINKKIKILVKKLKNTEKLEQLKKSGKDLDSSQIESLNNRKVTEKELAYFEELKKGYLVTWENQKQNDPLKLMFQLVHSIPIELKVQNNKFAAQTERLAKFRDQVLAEPSALTEFNESVKKSSSAFQKFVEHSEEIAFDEVTFKQLRTDLHEITSGINGIIQFKLSEQEKKRKQEQRLKEQEEKKKEEERKKEEKAKQEQKKGEKRGSDRGGNRNKKGNREGNRGGNKSGGSRGGGERGGGSGRGGNSNKSGDKN